MHPYTSDVSASVFTDDKTTVIAGAESRIKMQPKLTSNSVTNSLHRTDIKMLAFSLDINNEDVTYGGDPTFRQPTEASNSIASPPEYTVPSNDKIDAT